MQREHLNVMSEFLVMAATLLDIKCKMLLPKEVKEDGEEEDPRQDAGEPAESVDQDESDLPQGAIFIGVAEQPADADDGKEDLGREHSDHDRSL